MKKIKQSIDKRIKLEIYKDIMKKYNVNSIFQRITQIKRKFENNNPNSSYNSYDSFKILCLDAKLKHKKKREGD
ncbi:MAG: hypothetical protein ACFFAN_06695 [Promethearchaeota archaeon]